MLASCVQRQGDFNYLPTSHGEVIRHQYYTLSYIEKYEQAEWVAYELTREDVNGNAKRENDFREDPAVSTGSATPEDYKRSGYDRGHLAPAGDMGMNATSMSESFFLSNISPQSPKFNRGAWSRLEEQVRKWAIREGSIYVVTGPVFSESMKTIGPNHVAVPTAFYKVLLVYRGSDSKAIGLILTDDDRGNFKKQVISVDAAEARTGIDFFPALPDEVENQLEAKVDFEAWK